MGCQMGGRGSWRVGAMVHSTDLLGRVTSYKYDANQRLSTTTMPDGSQTVTAYDQSGNKTYETDEQGRVAQYFYNSRNQRSQTLVTNGSVVANRYDGRGNLSSTLSYRAGAGYWDASRSQPFSSDTTLVTESKSFFNVLGLPTRTIQNGEFGELQSGWKNVAVTSPSVEDQTLAGVVTPISLADGQSGAFSNTGWNSTGQALIANPAASSYTGAQSTDGRNVLVVANGAIAQTLSESVSPNTAYVLSVDVGSTLSNTATTYGLELYAGTTLLQSTSHAQRALQQGSFVSSVLRYTSSSTPPSGALQIRLVSSSGVLHFDNVRLMKRALLDANATESRATYNATGQLTASIDSKAIVSAWHNPSNPYDVDSNGVVNSLDQDLVTEMLTQHRLSKTAGPNGDALPPNPTESLGFASLKGGYFVDVNNDGLLNTTDSNAIASYLALATKPVISSGTSITYDALGRTTKRVLPNAVGLNVDSSIGSDRPTQTYQFDVWQGSSNLPLVGNRSMATDPLGRVTETTTDGRGRVISSIVRSSTGLVVNQSQTTYDAADNAITSVGARGFEAGNSPTDFTTQFTYDQRNQLIGVDAPDTLGVAGATLTHKFDFRYDQVGNQTQTRTGDAQTDVVYDSRNRPTTTTNRVSIGNSPNQVMKTTYDRASNVISSRDPLGRTGRVVFDANNFPVIGFDAMGIASSSEYTAAGQIRTKTDAKGRTNKTYFDYRDRAVLSLFPDPDGAGPESPSASLLTYNASDELLQQSVGAISTTWAMSDLVDTSYLYDRLGRAYLTINTDPDGAAGPLTSPLSFVRYDSVGNAIAQYSPRGVTRVNGVVTVDEKYKTTLQYDALDRLIRVEYPDIDLDPNTNLDGPLGKPVSQFTYDADGNQLSALDPLGRKTVSTYDAAGLVRTLSMFATGSSVASATTQMTYDDRGNLVASIDPLGITTKIEYDLLDRAVKVDGQDIVVDGVTQTRESRTIYDLANNAISSIDELGRATTVTYDGANRPISTLLPSADGQPRRSSTVFDTVGNPVRTIDANGQIQRSIYDDADRITKSIEPNGSTTEMAYDVYGNMISLKDPGGVQSIRVYDRLMREIQDGQVVGSGVVVAGGKITGVTPTNVNFRTSAYDVSSNLTEATDRNGRKITYQYDLLDQPLREKWGETTTTRTIENRYDLGSQVNSIVDSATTKSLAYTYDFAGRILSEQQSAGPTITMNYSYRADGSLDSLYPTSTSLPTTDPLFASGLKYSYDTVGRQTEVRNRVTSGATQPVSVAYRYDNSDQLVGMSRFGYPAVGAPVELRTSQTWNAPTGRLQQLQHTVVASNTTIGCKQHDHRSL